MDHYLFHHHVKHFRQAEETPSTIHPITEMGQYAKTEIGKDYWNGEKNIDVFKTDKYTNNFLHKLQRKENDPLMISTSISTTNMKKNYKIWKEKTSTSSQ